MTQHVPVLPNEVLQALDPKPGEHFVDATIGGGGHAASILERTAPSGRLLGIDLSAEAIARLRKEFKTYQDRITLVQGNFRDMALLLAKAEFPKLKGILMDLGFSSDELANPRLGLSFHAEGPLDMRLGDQELMAAEIVNSWPEGEISKIIQAYGEERYARQIARAIIIARKRDHILTTTQLVSVIVDALPRGYERGRIHPATRTFQALRIATNDELGNLEAALPQAVEVLATGGRLAVISFHSLEDRIVKRFFREEAGKTLRVLTKRPVQAGEEEIRRNPRARSAKLRVAEKI